VSNVKIKRAASLPGQRHGGSAECDQRGAQAFLRYGAFAKASTRGLSRRTMSGFKQLSRLLIFTLGLLFGFNALAVAHSGIVDGYGCHRGADKTSYHCHQGQFAGRTFKSREDFLRELRGGKSERLSPKGNPPLFDKKTDD
jgi:hypothetical protein